MSQKTITVEYEGPWRVELTYFKQSGKYYSEGSYVSHKLNLYEIWEELSEMFFRGERPGLVDGTNKFFTLIEVPEHPHNHPHLWVPLMA